MTAQADDMQGEIRQDVSAVAWSPDGSKIAVATAQYLEWESSFYNPALRILDSASMQVITTLYHRIDTEQGEMGGPDIHLLAWDASGQTLFADTGVHSIHRYDAATGSVLTTYEHGIAWVRSISLQPNGAHMAVVTDKGLFHIYDVQSGEMIVNLDLSVEESPGLRWVGWSPDGTKPATLGAQGIVRIWDGTTFTVTFTPIGQFSTGGVDPFLNAGAWSPDSRQLAVANNDGHVRIWDVASGMLVHALSGHGISGASYGLIWNPLSNQLIGAMPGGIHLWDAAAGSFIQDVRAKITAIDLSEDGRLAYGGSSLIDALNPSLLPTIGTAALPLPYSQIGIGIQPTDTLKNAVIQPSVLVSLRDENSARVQRGGIPITIQIEDNPAEGTLSGTMTRFTNELGVATFDDLSIDRAGNGYSLTARIGGVVSVTSSRFTVIEPVTPTATPSTGAG